MTGSGVRICPACKATKLSRYNPGPLCNACERAAGETGGIAPAWLWDSPPMRRAWARLDPAAAVAILRAVTGLSQGELGNLVEGWSQSTVSLIESGQRDTLFDIRKLLAFADAVDMPREALAPVLLGREDATLGTDQDATALEDTVDRRNFTGMAAGLLASAAMPHVQVPAQVDAAHVRYLHAAVEQLRGRDQIQGGGAILPQALHQFTRARRMVNESDYTETVGRQLLTVAGALGNEAGWAAFDHGDHQLARHLYREASLLAASSGDSELQTLLWSNMSMQNAYLARTASHPGLAREGLRLAQLAGDAARHQPSPRLHALIALREATAYAQLGDTTGFRAAITRARRELDRGPHPADPPWCGFVIEAEITGHEASGMMRLGLSDRSITLYQSAIDDERLTPRNRACWEAALAGALLDAGDRTQALTQGRLIIPALMAGHMSSARPLARLRGLRDAADKVGDEEFCVLYDTATRSLAS
ncbi:MAG TPA: helix-turn-helix transcriptional regulator [Pseudonocardiaceae bacterium]|nr:helix-turn-helix transcriptional regulator [Pseudonocardiaceae bacterium]